MSATQHAKARVGAGRVPRSGRFHDQRPNDLRDAAPWHRLAYIVRALPRSISGLVEQLDCSPEAKVLDFGCADSPYRHLLPTDVQYVGADLPGNPNAGLAIGQDGKVPAADGSFDLVLSTQVLEHVEDPGLYLAECKRVLRSGGQMLLSTHGIMVYHPDPVDFWRWTCAGLQRAVEEAGFEIERFEGVMGLAATGLQLVQDSIYPRFPALLRPGLALVLQTLIAVADRLEKRESRNLNALVFALIARKP